MVKCSKCGTQGRMTPDGEIVAYGCFFCSPVKLPFKHKVRKLDRKTKRETRKH